MSLPGSAVAKHLRRGGLCGKGLDDDFGELFGHLIVIDFVAFDERMRGIVFFSVTDDADRRVERGGVLRRADIEQREFRLAADAAALVFERFA